MSLFPKSRRVCSSFAAIKAPRSPLAPRSFSTFVAFLTFSTLLTFLTFVSTSVRFATAAEPTVLLDWNFDDDATAAADADAWTRNHLAPPTVQNGVYKAKFEGWDPFVVSPQFKLTPKPGQIVEIRMKSNGEAFGELFFAASNEGQYGGFSQSKAVSWDIWHDGEFHTYQILPNWLAEPQIVKIRVDVGRPTQDEIDAGQEIEIDYIKIVDLNVADATPLESANWNDETLAALKYETSNGAPGWRSDIFVLDPQKVGDHLYFEGRFTSDFQPSTPFPKAQIQFLSAEKNGVVSFDLPLRMNFIPSLTSAQTAEQTIFRQNVDLSRFDDWGGKAFRWELVLPNGCELRRLAFGEGPQGPGQFDYRLVGPKRAVTRIDSQTGFADVEYEFIVRNSGGETTSNLVFEKTFSETPESNRARTRFELPLLLGVVAQKTAVDSSFGTNPSGDRLTLARPDDSNVDPTVWTLDAVDSVVKFPENATLAPGEALRVVARLRTSAQCDVNVFEFSGESSSLKNAETTHSTHQLGGASIPIQFNVLPPLETPKAEYVPEPRPVESEYEIGAFYFPGWSQRSGWDKIDVAAPIRKPILGYYDEANPEVVDWQIKWAAENGIQFLFVDWYWRNGNISLEHWIKAFQAAKYRKYLKWAVMWANHTGPGTHSTEDMRAVTKYWIENYFKTPEYYTIDGKPVVVLWDRSVLDGDMIAEAKKEGVDLKPGEGVKKALEISRQVCVEAGLPGVYFIAIKWPERATDSGVVQKLADETFDATTIYHFMDPGDAPHSDPKLYPFANVVSASKPYWEARQKTGIIPFIPNISTGWDSRPWHGFRQTVVYNRTVEDFRRLCADYKTFADETGVKRAVLAPLNEWGEGSYIEPNKEFGFGMYEAIRETFCKEPESGFPPNFAPEEVGLGPYDLPPTTK